MEKVILNNKVAIMGEIVSGFTYSHKFFGEGFYMMSVRVQRLSEQYDTIPVMVSERLMDVSGNYTGELICVNGQFRSYNRHEERRNRLMLSVFAREVSFVDEVEESSNANQIFLDGYICKEPIYRKTSRGREIADILLAVNRPYGKSDHVPCIAWGRNSRYASNFKVGERCAVWGRVQSREYLKRLGEESYETRTAYEVSVSRLEIMENEHGQE